MALPPDPYVQGRPFPPEEPRDPNAGTVLDENERGKDAARGDYVDTLSHTPARPLTDEEEDAAEHDHERPGRTYAPASARVPKEPNSGRRQADRAGPRPAAVPRRHGTPRRPQRPRRASVAGEQASRPAVNQRSSRSRSAQPLACSPAPAARHLAPRLHHLQEKTGSAITTQRMTSQAKSRGTHGEQQAGDPRHREQVPGGAAPLGRGQDDGGGADRDRQREDERPAHQGEEPRPQHPRAHRYVRNEPVRRRHQQAGRVRGERPHP